ncbi:MAG: glycosyltransferase family 2 protein [Phycisphaerales bacterium]|nr:MAG: glycosyltransferase family 2 protein [Phycisphaerales bacterium]
MKRVSLVFPMYNEAANLEALRRRVCAVIDSLNEYRFEIVLVDDHSTDDTRTVARAWARGDGRVRYLRFSRNFGAHAALSAGLRTATGDGAVFLSADLQDPPEMIPALIRKWEDGYPVVWAARAARQARSWATRLTSAVYWRLMRAAAPNAAPSVAADAALIDRKVLDAFKRVNTRNDSVLASVCWLGFDAAYVRYDKAARAHGRSGWTLAKKVKLLVDSVVGFSYWPIRAMSLLGLSCAGVGFGFLAYVVYEALCGRIEVRGFATLASVMLLGMGILMVMVGVLGEYLWRVLDETRGRPNYIVEEEYGRRTSASPCGRDCSEPIETGPAAACGCRNDAAAAVAQ